MAKSSTKGVWLTSAPSQIGIFLTFQNCGILDLPHSVFVHTTAMVVSYGTWVQLTWAQMYCPVEACSGQEWY